MENRLGRNNMKENGKKLLGGAICILVLLLLVGGAMLYHMANKGPVTSYEKDFVPEFEEQQTQQTQEASITRGIKIPGYTTIPIAANTKDVDIELYNPEENQVHFQITFILNETGETIYQSKLIEPGQHLYHITLEKALEPGEHPITMQYSTYSADDEFTPKNGASVECVLKAE